MQYKKNIKKQLLAAVMSVALTSCASQKPPPVYDSPPIPTVDLTVPVGAKPSNSGDITLTVPVLDSQVVVKTSTDFGGAVYSLVFRGKEHIDSNDTGRLLQSASSFDDYGECFNPTEGGAHPNSDNPRGYIKSSEFLQGYLGKNELGTLNNMAFWRLPNEKYPNGCGTRKEINYSINKTVRSGHLFEKKMTVGLPGFPNVIEYKANFHVPESYSTGKFETLTGYMPKDFSLILVFDPKKNKESPAQDRDGEQPLPVILATPDRKYAMGVYSYNLPQPDYPRVGYGHFVFEKEQVNKWNCVFREKKVTPKNYQYTCLIVVGTVDEVKKTMQRLAAQ